MFRHITTERFSGLVAVILLSIPPAKARPVEVAPRAATDTGAAARVRVRDVVNVPAVSGLIIQELVTGIAFGALDVVAVIPAIDTFSGGEAAARYLTTAIGVGGVVGSLVAGALILRRRLRAVVGLGAAAFAASLVLLGLAPDLAVAFLAIALIAAANLLLDIVRTTIFQLVVPDAYRGRICGLMVTTGVGAEALGVLVVPILAAAFGLAFVTNVLAVATLIAAGLALALIGTSADRSVDMRPAAQP